MVLSARLRLQKREAADLNRAIRNSLRDVPAEGSTAQDFEVAGYSGNVRAIFGAFPHNLNPR